MRVELIEAGWFTAPAGVWRRGEPLDRRVRFPIPAYVVETERERILVDTGLHPGAVADPTDRYGRPDLLGNFELELEASVADRIDLGTSRRSSSRTSTSTTRAGWRCSRRRCP